MRRFLGLMMLVSGCGQPAGPTPAAEPRPAPVVDEAGEPIALPAGSACTGTGDCPESQVCVEAHCRHVATSASGEILATAARAQFAAGDLEGAVRTFDQAIDAYARAGAPAPPGLLCSAAQASLSTGDAALRESAAARADACLRGSLPGDPDRASVLAALGRLRFDGIELAAFDADEPPERFFTQEPSRPTVDAIRIQLSLPDETASGWDRVREVLEGESAQRAMADCFVQDWEIRHERSAEAALVLAFSTRMRDMGDYDVFTPEIQVSQASVTQEGFEPCLAGALGAVLSAETPRSMGRVVAWQAPIEIRANLR